MSIGKNDKKQKNQKYLVFSLNSFKFLLFLKFQKNKS